jgi:hypothetical protein
MAENDNKEKLKDGAEGFGMGEFMNGHSEFVRQEIGSVKGHPVARRRSLLWPSLQRRSNRWKAFTEDGSVIESQHQRVPESSPSKTELEQIGPLPLIIPTHNSVLADSQQRPTVGVTAGSESRQIPLEYEEMPEFCTQPDQSDLYPVENAMMALRTLSPLPPLDGIPGRTSYGDYEIPSGQNYIDFAGAHADRKLPRNWSITTSRSYHTARSQISHGTSRSISNASYATAAMTWPEEQSMRAPLMRENIPSFPASKQIGKDQKARGDSEWTSWLKKHEIIVDSFDPFDQKASGDSEWISWLKQHGVIVDPFDELNWSGKGQHVEYGAHEQSEIPLKLEKTIGHSATALVESVRCRRIRLARKRIRCTRRLTQYDTISEVQQFQRLQHFHLVRVIGTYIVNRDLSILLYPVAEWNLEEFMDDTVNLDVDPASKNFSDSYNHRNRVLALRTFFGCLSSAINLFTQRT